MSESEKHIYNTGTIHVTHERRQEIRRQGKRRQEDKITDTAWIFALLDTIGLDVWVLDGSAIVFLTNTQTEEMIKTPECLAMHISRTYLAPYQVLDTIKDTYRHKQVNKVILTSLPGFYDVPFQRAMQCIPVVIGGYVAGVVVMIERI